MKKERNRGRTEKRETYVFKADLNTQQQKRWPSVQTIIVVKRTVLEKGREMEETAYFISDLPPETGAEYFAEGIRKHWRIESFHFVKDVTFKEDASQVHTGNSPLNYSLIRTIIINIFRKKGFKCIQAAIEKCANNVPYMMSLF